MKTYDELVKENEGLKERGQKVIESLHETIDKQKAEIERLTEENEYLDMVAKQALADYQNAQVQVDELIAEKEDLYFQNQNLQTYIDNHEAIWKRNAEQAVKDTAKEVLEHVVDSFLMRKAERYFFKEWLVEKYGVEVE
jgi:chromosome segregation ATPase